jgi:DNA-binding NtrC family response regulator
LQRGAEISPSAFLLADSIGAGPGPVGRQAPAEGHITPLREVERRHIIDTFERLSRNYTRTARALGISINTLKRKLQRYGLR